MTEKEAIKELNSCHAYELSSGCRDLAKEALEKQIPKKPLSIPTDDTCLYYELRCPTCNAYMSGIVGMHHCECGQTLDWKETKLDNFIEECKQPTPCKEYKRPKEIDDVINGLIDFDSYSFYQDNINKLITYVEELEAIIKAIVYVVVKPEYC